MDLFKPKQTEARVVNFNTDSGSNTEKKAAEEVESNYMSFGSHFADLGIGNLSLPFIMENVGDSTYVPFGMNNLFPQEVNQLYYTSPINGAIINFKTNATVGGGFTIEAKTDDYKDKVKVMVFEKRFKIAKMLPALIKDYIMHESCYVIITFENGIPKSFKRIPREKVRNSRDRRLYFICEDWRQRGDIKPIRRFNGVANENEMLLCFENDSVGMDTYSLASYTSALNWFELDGKMSLFHKNNIENSIYPSFVFLFPKKPSGDKEKLEIKKTIEGAKGAKNAGKVLALFANKLDQMPKLESIPTNQNDKLFDQTDERIDSQACKAHCIDPLLLGIRVSGKLGSGNELKQSYTILEKNSIIPLRNVGESIFNEILSIFRIKAVFKINEYQIINEAIVQIEDENSKIVDALNSLPDQVVSKVLEYMSKEKVLALVGVKEENKKIEQSNSIS